MSELDRGAPAPDPGSVDVLFTCTANRVRSPLAATIAAAHVARLGLPVRIGSAGQLESGRAAVDEMVGVASRLGHDLSGHRSTRVSAELLELADLVVTMTGQHVVDLAGLAPGCRDRTITLKEWAAASSAGRPIRSWTPRDVRSWAAGVSDRPLNVLLSGDLDVADPIGRPKRFYKRTAQEIEQLLTVCFAQH